MAPSLDEQQGLRALIVARLDSAADFARGRLVRTAPTPVHLVFDSSHRLLALSRLREPNCRVPGTQLLGSALCRYVTPQIVAQEARLDDLGWYKPAHEAVEFDTEGSDDPVMPIERSRMRWVHLHLSDGSFVRLAASG